jgi:inositol phosphorylceramide mannosyltransferase catalytic subunit
MKKTLLHVIVLTIFSLAASTRFNKNTPKNYPESLLYLIFDKISAVTYLGSLKTYVNRILSNEAHRQRIRILLTHLDRPLSQNNYLQIPKKIHQIWFGGPFPEHYKKIAQKWQEMHPGWEYKLWTEQDLDSFATHNPELLHQNLNLAEKSDIFRCEILYNYGGFFVDADFECLKSFEPFCYCGTFVAGLEHPDASPLFIGNSFIGAQKGHPLIKKCLDTFKDFRHEKDVPSRTGPAHLTRSFFSISEDERADCTIVPPVFFYPRGMHTHYKNLPLSLFIKPETYGIHYWDGTWMNKESHTANLYTRHLTSIK